MRARVSALLVLGFGIAMSACGGVEDKSADGGDASNDDGGQGGRTSREDAGAQSGTCALFGEHCTTPFDCCNGIDCVNGRCSDVVN